MNMRTTKIIIALIILVMPFYACQLFFGEPPGPEIIKIVSADTSSDTLVLKNAGNEPATTFEVKAGRTINWLVNTNNVANIDSIYKKPTTTSDNIFKTGPARIGSSKNWTASIDYSATVPQFVDYNIDWTDKDGKKHTYDPRIQVKS